MWKALVTIGFGVWLVSSVPAAAANPFEHLKSGASHFAEFNPPGPENQFLPGKPRARGEEKRAASRAMRAFPDAKVLSVNMQRNGSYRVKLLSSGGVVKYVFVDSNGEVFE